MSMSALHSRFRLSDTQFGILLAMPALVLLAAITVYLLFT
jgi:hypothetical protein